MTGVVSSNKRRRRFPRQAGEISARDGCMTSIVRKRHSLKTRITLATLLIFVVGIWSLTFYASRMLREDMKSLLGEQQLSTVSMLGVETNRELSERMKWLESVAETIPPAMLGNPAALQEFLAQRLILPSLFSGGGIIYSPDGTAIADSLPATGRIGVNYMDIDTVAAALKEGKSTIGRPVIGKKLAAPVFGMTAPIHDPQGKVIGALAGVVNLGSPNFLDKITANHYGKTGGYLLVAPQHRLIVTASNKSRVMEALPAPGVSPIIDRRNQGYEGTEVFFIPTGVEVLSSARSIPIAGWYLSVILPTEEAFAPIRAMQQRMLQAAIFLTLLAGVLTWWMLRRQLAPMLAAAKSLAKQSASSQPPQPLPVTTEDEIGELIGGFNQLLERLGKQDGALRESYEEIRSILETSIDGFWRVDAEGRLREVNPAYCRQSGYTREELLAMHIPDLEVMEGATETAAHIRRIVVSGGDLFESRHQRKDGSVWDVEVSVICRNMAGGQLFVFLRDITQRKKLERQVNDQKALLEDLVEQRTTELSVALQDAKLADQSKDAFLANMSHELRTPLNAVIGMAGMARALGTDPKQLDYLDKITTSGKHLNRIINDLLDLSKIAAGHIEMENIAFSVRESVQRCVALMSDRAAEKGVALVATVDPALPEDFRGDPARIEQVILNLLGNAIKFTATGRVEIRVSLNAREEIGTCVAIEVEDTGIGMSPEDLERLFKPFSQADASVSRKYGGTGLGLAISRQLVEMMNGDISVSSRVGQGTTFKLRIWLDQGNGAEQSASVPDSPHALPAYYRDARVLVADDQPLNREIVESLLAAVGIAPRVAEDGQQALDILIEAGPGVFDLVLMDIQMPVMDGLSATRALRARAGFESLPVIAMTAHTMKHEQEIALEAGVNGHIGKPFDSISFYRTLAQWIPAGKQAAAPLVAAVVAEVVAEAVAEAVPVATETAAPVTPAGDVRDHLRGVDLVNGLARFNGKEDRYRHWLADFVENAGELPGQLRSDLAAGQPQSAAKAAHTFKGRVGMLGMDDLHGIVSALEHALRDGTPAEELLRALEKSIGEVREELRRFFAGEGVPATPRLLEKVVWKETYSVGVPAMDAQHKKLVNMINQLADCHAERGVGASGCFQEILSAMFDYTQVHFKSEEAYLQKIGYPQLAAHEKEHQVFLEKATALSMVSLDGVQDSAGLYDYLKTWLLDHILRSDMQYRFFVEGETKL
jgi:hemerythrin-like metal-binding protein/PAS domain S-box-containing protein